MMNLYLKYIVYNSGRHPFGGKNGSAYLFSSKVEMVNGYTPPN